MCFLAHGEVCVAVWGVMLKLRESIFFIFPELLTASHGLHQEMEFAQTDSNRANSLSADEDHVLQLKVLEKDNK